MRHFRLSELGFTDEYCGVKAYKGGSAICHYAMLMRAWFMVFAELCACCQKNYEIPFSLPGKAIISHEPQHRCKDTLNLATELCRLASWDSFVAKRAHLLASKSIGGIPDSAAGFCILNQVVLE
jgi:hypothetical protein